MASSVFFSQRAQRSIVKPVTDEQVFHDKFLCDKFYLPSALVIEKIVKIARADEEIKHVT